MRMDIEEIQELIERMSAFNRLPLSEVEWHKGGVKLDVPANFIEDFKFTGLSNKCFVEMEFWRGPSSVEELVDGKMQVTYRRDDSEQ